MSLEETDQESVFDWNWDKSNNGDERIKPVCCKLTREELVQELEQYRKMNIKLLEEKRHLLLQSQENFKLEMRVMESNQKIQELTEKVERYEGHSRQLNSSIRSNERIETNLRDKVGCSCNCTSNKKLEEIVKVNHIWQKDFLKLQAENVDIKAQLELYENQLKVLDEENTLLKMEQNNPKNEKDFTPETEDFNLTPDDLEAIKQQLAIFKDDYEQEQEDNKKLQKTLKEVQHQLLEANKKNDELTEKNKTIKDNYRRVSFHKEHLLQELRRLSTSSLPLSPVTMNSEYHLSGHSSVLPKKLERNTSSRKIPKLPGLHYDKRDSKTAQTNSEHIPQYEITENKTGEVLTC